MKEISEQEALRILRQWYEEQRPVEVTLRYSEGLMQSHPGRITLEPEGLVAIVCVIDKDRYLKTVFDVFAFETIKLSEVETAITLEEPFATSDTFISVTVACRKQ